MNRNTGGQHVQEELLVDGPIGIRNASFSWSKEDKVSTPLQRRFMLRIEGELIFAKGEINVIFGPTGSGKTSLLMALLGESYYTRDFVPLYDVPHQAKCTAFLLVPNPGLTSLAMEGLHMLLRNPGFKMKLSELICLFYVHADAY